MSSSTIRAVSLAAPAELITRGGWDSVIDLNLSAPFALAQAAFPYLSRPGRQGIVNMTLTPVERGAPRPCPFD